jgi:hypothetical protein
VHIVVVLAAQPVAPGKLKLVPVGSETLIAWPMGYPLGSRNATLLVAVEPTVTDPKAPGVFVVIGQYATVILTGTVSELPFPALPTTRLAE